MQGSKKKSILVTGVTGVGKTTLSKHLQELGYESYSIEDIVGMFAVYKKGTRQIFEDYDITNVEHVRNSDWICNVDKLKNLLNKQKAEVAFYVGAASKVDEIMALFDKVILLKVSNEKLQERLESREGVKEQMGNTEETRRFTFEWKDWWENEMEKKGAIVVDANGSRDDVARNVIKKIYMYYEL